MATTSCNRTRQELDGSSDGVDQGLRAIEGATSRVSTGETLGEFTGVVDHNNRHSRIHFLKPAHEAHTSAHGHRVADDNGIEHPAAENVSCGG
jgi:hypothetical protein